MSFDRLRPLRKATAGFRYTAAAAIVAAALAVSAVRRLEDERTALLVRERAARAEAEAANRAKDAFLTIVSHELRSPLTAILGWCRMLRSGRLPPADGDRALDTIEQNTRLQAK